MKSERGGGVFPQHPRDCLEGSPGAEEMPLYLSNFRLRLVSIFCLLATMLITSATSAVQLKNWRFPYYMAGTFWGYPGSTSGMFWDDVDSQPLGNSLLWPDSGHFYNNHWILEPAVSFTAQTNELAYIDTLSPIHHYSNDKKVAQLSQQRGNYYNSQVLNDIRYKNILLRQVLDVDSRNKDDLDFRGKTDRFAAGRIEEAYCQVNWKYGMLRVGRLNRNWGPFPDRSLLLSSNTHTYE